MDKRVISCDICRDLMPLVKDGVASPGSVEAVEEHIKGCCGCREMYESTASAPSVHAENAFAKIKQDVQIFVAMLIMIGIFFGISLTGNADMFYNIIIMPIIGALGYGVFRKKVFFVIPLLISGVSCLSSVIGLLGERVLDELVTMLMMSLYYDLFAIVGAVAAWLLHFALRKDD